MDAIFINGKVVEASSRQSINIGPGMLPRASAFIGACVAACVVTLVAQDSRPAAPQEPTFRTATQSVRVDLYASVNGIPLTDLRQEEIRLFEDGSPQKVQTFERITFTSPSAIRPAEPRTLEESRRLAIDPHTRLFVLFLPTADARFDLGPASQARRLLIEPLHEMLGGDDLIAVMTPYTRIADLTFHRRVPLNNSRFLSNDDIADPKHRLWDACYPPMAPGSPNAEMKARHRELRTFEALDALVEHLGGLREERKHVLITTDGFRLYTENPRLSAKSGRTPPGFPIGRGPEAIGTVPKLGQADALTSDRERECEEDLSALASINHSNRLEELAGQASRNNVSFTPVSLARLQTGRGVTGAAGALTAENTTTLAIQSSLRGLAEDTGGMAIVSTNDIRGRLEELMTITSAYYLLGYTPASAALDGRFHRIEVRIDRPGVRVHARPGYVAAKAPDVSRVPVREPEKPPGAFESAVAAIAGSAAARALHVRTATWVHPGAAGRGASTVWVIGELVTRRRPAVGSASPLSAQLTILPPGSGPTISKRVDVSDGGSFEFEITEPFVPGDYLARITVTGADGEQMRETIQLAIGGNAPGLGEPILLRGGPAAGRRFARTANPSFQRTEHLRLELPTTSAVRAEAVLRDSRGTALGVPVTLSERPGDSDSWRWIAADVTLAPLAPAVYAIELTQGGTAHVTAFRVVP